MCHVASIYPQASLVWPPNSLTSAGSPTKTTPVSLAVWLDTVQMPPPPLPRLLPLAH